MRNPLRIWRIMRKLKKLWRRYPDQRFGQLLMNLGVTDRSWHTEDGYWEDRIDRALDEGLGKQQIPTAPSWR